MRWRLLFKSLPVRFVIASLIVQAIIMSLLIVNSIHIIDSILKREVELRLNDLNRLINTSLAAPLAENDTVTLQEILNEIVTKNSIVYAVLFSAEDEIIAATGWPKGKPLPALSTTMESLDGNFNTRTVIQLAGQPYGLLRYGISTEFLSNARGLIRESFHIALAAMLLSTVILALLGYWMTRPLRTLVHASKAIAQGKFDIELPVTSSDEVGQLANSFNAMARAIRERVEQLGEQAAKFHAIADYTYDWENWYSADGKLIWVNPSVERITGYTLEECLQMPDFQLAIVDPEDHARVSNEFKRAIRGSVGNDFEFRIIHKNGSLQWVAASWQPIFDAQGRYLGIRSSVRDIAERKLVEQVLENKITELVNAEEMQRRFLMQAQQEQARLTSLLSAMNIGILFVNVDNRVNYYNPAFLRIWMIRDSSELIGKLATEVLNYSANVLAKPDHFSKHILHVLGTHEVSESFEVSMADGRQVMQLSYPVRDQEGRFIGRLWIYEDVTRERQTAEQLIYLAERDSLTGLYNRHRFQEELARMIAWVERHNTHGALLFFDLDEFKYVNDTFGHRAGDAMLIRVAGEVSTLIRRSEIFSRLGGDEFAILAPNASENDARILAERIVRAISQIPFRYEGQNLRLTTSLGIALYPKHASTSEELIAHADAAMYQAKEAGKNAWRIYRHDLDASRAMVNRLSWNERINRALEKNLLVLHYQGIYHAQQGNLSHLEVLVRMVDEEDPTRIIMPGHFIPFAEKSGKILDIDRWVIREAIRILSSSPQVPPLAVNISGRSFDEPSLPQYISEQLEHFQVLPTRLHVELTETAAVSDLHDAQRFIEALHQTGCKVCLDDFGAGFSSFAYLKHLRADILKIDGVFIRDLPNDPDSQLFVKAIVDVARGLRKITVAEFVEDAEALEMVKKFGVDFVQGYHLDMPRADHPALSMSNPG